MLHILDILLFTNFSLCSSFCNVKSYTNLSLMMNEEKIAVQNFQMNCRCCCFQTLLCCSLYERTCVCAVSKIFTKFVPANNFCQHLRVTCKRSCTSAGNAQAQLHFRNDQQRAFGISNISNSHPAERLKITFSS